MDTSSSTRPECLSCHTAPKLPCAVRGPAFLVTLPMFVGGQFAGLFIDALSAAMGPYWEASVR